MIDPATKIAVLDEMIQASLARCQELEAQTKEESKLYERLYFEKQKISGATNGVELNGHQTYQTNHGSLPERIGAVIQAAEEPMRARDIVVELEKRGVRTDSPKGLLPSVLSALNRRSDLFRRVDRGTYTLVNPK